MKRSIWLPFLLCSLLSASVMGAEVKTEDYANVTQGDLVAKREGFSGKKVQFSGNFQFAGSDFCYQIRKTKINTKNYFCFAVGVPSVVRLYLRKDHPAADQLLNLKKGDKLTVLGVFDYVGSDYNYVIVDKISVDKSP